MKIYKKFGLVLTALIAIFGVLGVWSPQKAFATSSTASDYQSCIDTAKFVTIAEIDCNLSSTGGSSTGTAVQFIDKNPEDENIGDLNYTPYASGSPDQSIFCDPGGNGFGITVLNISGRSLHASDAGNKIVLAFKLGHTNSSTGCDKYSGSSGDSATISGAATNGISNLLAFSADGTSVTTLGDTSGGNVLKNINLGVDSVNSKADGTLYYVNPSPVTCSGSNGIANILIATVSNGHATANYYSIIGSNNSLVPTESVSKYSDLSAYLTKINAVNCYVVKGSVNLSNIGDPGTPFSIYGTPPTADSITGAGSSNGTGGTGSGSTDACDASAGGFTLAWVLCPVLGAMDGLATVFMNLFESLLPFTVCANPSVSGGSCSTSTSATQVSCGTNSKGVAIANCSQSLSKGVSEVHNTWSLIRVIASSVIIIVLLIMVISQAIGGGPFEAYTVRKMLPKLVAAIVLIQISWPLAAWVVNLVNDIGDGLASLLYLPFGGASAMDFGSLLNNAQVNGQKVFFLSWMVGLVGVLSLAALPTIAAACVAGVIGLAAAIGVLIFRKILIIMLLIFSPIAIIAWTLPGSSTDKVWKMWKDNFIKVLFMYPLIVSVIAVGRIFAHVVGTQDNTVFLNFIFVMIGYFAPLFLLLKSYKWGGTIMSSVGNGVGGFQKSLNGVVKPGVKQFASDFYTGKRANSYDPRAKNFAMKFRDENGKLLRKPMPGFLPGTRPTFKANGKFWRSIQGGRLIPSARGRGALKARGKKWSSEMAELKDADIDNFSRAHEQHGLTPDEIEKHLKEVKALSSDDEYDHFSKDQQADGMDGVGAGKWSLQLLTLEAFKKGDTEMLKAIARYHIEHGSLLEMASGRFRMPERWMTDPRTGKKVIEWVPFQDWGVAQDQAYKDSSLWKGLSSMRGNYPPNNWPAGGATYKGIYAEAGFKYLPNGKENSAYNPTAHMDKEMFEALGGTLKPDGTIPTEREQDDAFNAQDTKYMPKNKYYAQKYQDIREALGHDLKHGGNAAVSTMREAHEIAQGTWHHPGAATPALAKEMVRDILLAGDSRDRLSEIAIIGNKAHADLFNDLIKDLQKDGGATPTKKVYFTDIIGQVHEIKSAEDVLRVTNQALEQRQAIMNANQQAISEGREPPTPLPALGSPEQRLVVGDAEPAPAVAPAAPAAPAAAPAAPAAAPAAPAAAPAAPAAPAAEPGTTTTTATSSTSAPGRRVVVGPDGASDIVEFSPGHSGVGPTPMPVEVRINHEELADAIAQANARTITSSLRKVLHESGMHPTGKDPDDDDDTPPPPPPPPA